MSLHKSLCFYWIAIHALFSPIQMRWQPPRKRSVMYNPTSCRGMLKSAFQTTKSEVAPFSTPCWACATSKAMSNNWSSRFDQALVGLLHQPAREDKTLMRNCPPFLHVGRSNKNNISSQVRSMPCSTVWPTLETPLWSQFGVLEGTPSASLNQHHNPNQCGSRTKWHLSCMEIHSKTSGPRLMRYPLWPVWDWGIGFWRYSYWTLRVLG